MTLTCDSCGHRWGGPGEGERHWPFCGLCGGQPYEAPTPGYGPGWLPPKGFTPPPFVHLTHPHLL